MASPSTTPPSHPSALSEQDLQTLLEHLDRHFETGGTYHDALNHLQDIYGSNAYAAQRTSHTIGRHAIRLTLQWLRQNQNHLASSTAAMSVPPRPNRAATTSQPQTSQPPTTRHPVPTHPPLPLPPQPRMASYKKPTSLLPQHVSAVQKQYLASLGRHFRLRRQNQRLTVVQLHHVTQIPLQHLQALESGQIDQLPDSTNYLWGMVRIWGNALKLDGLSLADGIPGVTNPEVLPVTSAPPNSVPKITFKTAVPTPADSSKSSQSAHSSKSAKSAAHASTLQMQATATHTDRASHHSQTAQKAQSEGSFSPSLVAYGTLAVGAVAGLHWMSEAIEPNSPPPPAAPQQAQPDLKQQAEIQRQILPMDMAQPEVSRRGLRRN